MKYFAFGFLALVVLADPVPSEKPEIPGMTDVPECKKLLDQGDAIHDLHGCSVEINTCFKEVNALAPRCLAKDIKYFKDHEPQIYECVTKTSVENMKKSWFGTSCKWHSGLLQCLSGAEATDDFEDHHEETITDEDHKKNQHAVEEYFRKVTEKYKDLGECWNSLREKMRSCFEQAMQHCNNFGVCSGKMDPADDASDVMKTWHKIQNQLDKEEEKQLKVFLDEAEKCLLSDHGHGHAEPEHHGEE